MSIAALCAACSSPRPAPISGDDANLSAAEVESWRSAAQFDQRLAEKDALYRDENVQQMIDGIVTRLAPQFGIDRSLVRVRIVENPLVHAFTLPNGSIYVFTGFVAMMDNEDQLALVLAHEMAHFVGRHSVAKQADAERNRGSAAALATLLTIASGGVAAHPEILRLIFSMGDFSRDYEREADARGLAAVVAAGFDAPAALQLHFTLLRQQDEAGISEPTFGSHPQLAERIANGAASLQALGLEGPSEATAARVSPAFTAATSALLLVHARDEMDIGRYTRARASIAKHLAASPGSAAGYVALGDYNRRVGDGDDAIDAARRAFEHAVGLDPNLPTAQRELGLLYRAQGRSVEAKTALARYLALTPDAIDRPIIEAYIAESTASAP